MAKSLPGSKAAIKSNKKILPGNPEGNRKAAGPKSRPTAKARGSKSK
jgi:hypothetical protein